MSFPIVEYRTDPQRDIRPEGIFITEWYTKRAIDLRWVASIQMYTPETTQMTLCGSGHSFEVDGTYGDIMRDWIRAKGLP